MKKILIPTKLDSIARELLIAHGGYEVIQDEKTPLSEQAAKHPGTHALIVRSEKVDAAIIDALPSLKVVIRAGAGFNTIDIAHARAKGVDVMNTPGANANAVAEEVVALMLADARHLIAADASCRAGEWEKTKFMGRELHGKTLGIMGLGHIGRLLARRVSGFDMKLLGYDPVLSEDRAREMGVTLVSVEELFAESDYISLHIPENEHTRNMVNTRLLGMMKDGGTLVNCARSGVVSEADLRAIRAVKKIRYLNDVYPKDEAGPKSVADVADIMLPHLGASTREANWNAARMAGQILIDYDDKGNAAYVVNRDIPLGLDEAYGNLAHTLATMARGILGRNSRLKVVETSVYGDLAPFADWMIVPIVCALHPDFNRSMDHRRAVKYLSEMGVDYTNRDTDPGKKYGNSITVDLTGGETPDSMRTVSVRGTLTEGNPVLARINDFDKLYFEATGHLAVFIFEDRPGVLSAITTALAKAGINIDDVRNPHDASGKHSIALLRLNQAPTVDLLDSIRAEISAHVAVCVSIR